MKSGSGWKPLQLSQSKQEPAGEQGCDRVGTTRRSLARNFDINKFHVHHVLKKAGVKHHKRQKAPYTTQAEEQRQQARLRKMTRNLCKSTSDVIIVMNDESYFPFRR